MQCGKCRQQNVIYVGLRASSFSQRHADVANLDSALYPTIGQIERAAGFARDERRLNWLRR
jgi:hypothetical protein